MNEKEFLNFFTNLFDGLDEGIEMNTEFRYLDEWSSLTGLAFLTDLEDKFGIKISVSEFKEAETIKDLYVLYKNKL